MPIERSPLGFVKDQMAGFPVPVGSMLVNDPDHQPTLKNRIQSAVTGGYTVVVAEDDTDLNHLLRDTLSEAGFSVLTSGTGLKALDMIRYAGNVDVVLLDYSMPVLDGSQTIGYMRKYFPGVKAIGVTGVDCSQLPDTYREGVEKLLLKPVETSDLIDAIYAVIGVPVVAQAEKIKRSISRARFWLWYALFVVISIGLLAMLHQATIEVLTPR